MLMFTYCIFTLTKYNKEDIHEVIQKPDAEFTWSGGQLCHQSFYDLVIFYNTFTESQTPC